MNLLFAILVTLYHSVYMSSQNNANYIVRNKIDYIMISKRFKNCVKSANTYPGADANSFHNFLGANLRLRLKSVGISNQKKAYKIESFKYKQARLLYPTHSENQTAYYPFKYQF